MANTGIATFRNNNNGTFTVSGVSGHLHGTTKYLGNGILNVELYNMSATVANAVYLTNFPYRFKIINALYNHFAVETAAGGSIEIYNGTTSNATQYVCACSAEASRVIGIPPTINFNKTTVEKTGKLIIMPEGIADASAITLKGSLTLFIRPI